MPFESSLPLVVTCLLGAVIGFFVWLGVQNRWLLAVAILLAAAGVGSFAVDWAVETDREYLLALFPRLARAAERQEDAPVQGEAATLWTQGRSRMKPQSICSSCAALSAEAACANSGPMADCSPTSTERKAYG